MESKITKSDKLCMWYKDLTSAIALTNELVDACSTGKLDIITTYISHNMIDKLYEKVGNFNVYITAILGTRSIETVTHLLSFPSTHHFLNRDEMINAAVKFGSIQVLTALLETDEIDINIEPISPLMVAISIGDVQKVRILLNYDPNIWQVDEGNFNAIDLARDYGHHNIAELIERYYLRYTERDEVDADLIKYLFDDTYKLSLFLMYFPNKLINIIIKHGVDEMNILEYAIRINRVDVIETLLRSPHYPLDLTPESLIHIDFTLNVKELLELFETKGISINSVLRLKVNDIKVNSLVLYYCTQYYKNPELYNKYFQELVKYGADVDMTNSDGINPLIYAALYDTESDLLENILEFNPHVTVTYNGRNVFELIGEKEDMLDLMKNFFNRRLGEKYDYRAPILYNANNEPMKYTKDEWQFIMENFTINPEYSNLFDPKYYESKIRGLSDAMNEDTVCDLVDTMMRRINDIMEQNFQSVLTYFIVKYFRTNDKDDFSVVVNILENNPSRYVNTGDPMTIACEYQMVDVVEQLLRCNNLHIPVSNTTFEHCLFNAIRKKNVEIVNMILKNNRLDLEQINFHGDTPLLVACNGNFTEGVRLLLKYGANVDIQNDGGQTPLMIMAMNQNVTSMNEILRYHPNVNLTDVNGETYKYYMMMPEMEFLTFMNI